MALTAHRGKTWSLTERMQLSKLMRIFEVFTLGRAMKYIYSNLIFAACFSAYAAPSCSDPLIVSKSIVLELTDDIIITGKSSPFIASPVFGASGPATLTINSKTGNSVIIASTGAWDLSTFNAAQKIIEFTGNAQLICKPGAKILGYGGTLRFAQTSRWIVD